MYKFDCPMQKFVIYEKKQHCVVYFKERRAIFKLYVLLLPAAMAWLGWPSLNLCSSIQRWLVCMFESHSMSNLEPIIRSIIYLENDTLVHINLAIVISRQKLSLSLARASTLSSSEYGLSFSLCLVS